MDTKHKQEIEESSKQLLTMLKDGDIDQLLALSHPFVMEKITSRDMESISQILNEMGAFTLMNRAELEEIIEVTIRPAPEKFQPVPCRYGDNQEKQATIVAFKGSSTTVMALVRIPNIELDRMAYVYFSEFEGDLRWVAFDIQALSNNGKDAQHYLELARDWAKSKDQYPATIAYLTATYLSASGRNMTTMLHEEIKQESTTYRDPKRFEQELMWTIQGKQFEVFDVGIFEMDIGLVHYFRYISEQPLTEETITIEARQLMRYVAKTFPEVLNQYDRFIFDAYAELPSNQQKQYPSQRVILDPESFQTN